MVRMVNEGKRIILTDGQQIELKRRVRSQTLDARSVRRARRVLLAADGIGNHEIAQRVQMSRWQAIAWRGRYAIGGLKAIESDHAAGASRASTRRRSFASRIGRSQTKPQGAMPLPETAPPAHTTVVFDDSIPAGILGDAPEGIEELLSDFQRSAPSMPAQLGAACESALREQAAAWSVPSPWVSAAL